MRLAVITCHAYRDALEPFLSLLNRFWPNHPPLWLVTDKVPDVAISNQCAHVFVVPGSGSRSWCPRLAAFAETIGDNEPVILLQEDFLLNAPVNIELIEHALQQMKLLDAGAVRLYPCPGSDSDYGDPYVGIVSKGTRYRISCQISVWRPSYLHAIARQCSTPADFEINGSALSNELPDAVLAWRREAKEWPISYICTAIVAGKFLPDAKRLCDQYGIVADFSRGFQPAL